MKIDYTELPDAEAAEAITNHVKQWDADEPLRYASLGLMMLAVIERQLWKLTTDPVDGFPCRSFARWVRLCAPNGYSTCYAALKDVQDLPDVPPADLAQIPQSNFRTMKQLSTAVRRDPDVLQAAKGRGLAGYINANHPDQHITDRKAVNVLVDDAEMVYSVLDQAVELHDAIDRGHALEMIAAMARLTWELESEVKQSIRVEASR